MQEISRKWLEWSAKFSFGLVTLLSIFWALDIPQNLGLLFFPEQFAALILGCAVASVFLSNVTAKKGWHFYFNIAFGLAAILVATHLFVRFPTLSEGAFFHQKESLLIGFLLLITTVEALRRISGWSLIIIFIILVGYSLFSDLVPGRLQGAPIPFLDIVRFIGTDSTATLGAPLQVASFIVILFIFFGQLLLISGGASVLTDASRRLSGNRRGATARMAVIASGFMGSISGSAVSNVTTTGVITIPAMKRSGFRSESAGAIEAVASTGGQIMPPVMGAAAFLMAEFLQIPLQEVLLAALIPAFLYFFSVYLQISLISAKYNLGAGHQDEMRSWSELLPICFSVVGAVFVLIVGLFVFYMTAGKAVVAACGFLIIVGLLNIGVKNRLSVTDVLGLFFKTGEASAHIIIVCAVAGMIIGLLSTSGLSFGLSFVLLQLGENSVFILLVLTAIVSIILGMGLPTTGVYLLLSTLAAPPLVELGIGMLEAHFFVLYFGLLSMISPPVALAAFAAASIAQADPMKTAFESIRFGWIAFILPFIFVYQPALLMQGTVFEVLFSLITLVISTVLITVALVGYGYSKLPLFNRGLIAVLGLLALFPAELIDRFIFVKGLASIIGFILIISYIRNEDSTSHE